MSDVALVEQQPTRQALAVEGRSAPRKVTGKLRKAIASMVWDGSCRDEAAQAAGLAVHSLREALRKPHVKAAYLAELEVLRTSERARNIHALVDVRSGSNAMARVQAVKALEQMDEISSQRGGSGVLRSPGMVIQIINQPALTPHYHQVEAKPLQTNTFGPTDAVRRDE